MLWRDRVIGWANATVSSGSLEIDFGYASGGAPRDRMFARELDAEVERLRAFLRMSPAATVSRSGTRGGARLPHRARGRDD
jgi:hypothetical protein